MPVGVANQLAEGGHHADMLGMLLAEIVRMHATRCKLRPGIAGAKEFIIDGTGREHAQPALLADTVKALDFQKHKLAPGQQLGLGRRQAYVGKRCQRQVLQRQQLGHAAAQARKLDDYRA